MTENSRIEKALKNLADVRVLVFTVQKVTLSSSRGGLDPAYRDYLEDLNQGWENPVLEGCIQARLSFTLVKVVFPW